MAADWLAWNNDMAGVKRRIGGKDGRRRRRKGKLGVGAHVQNI